MWIRYQPVKLAHKLFEAIEGSNKRPPVIFMHGLMEQKETWQSIPQRVADMTKRKVYAFDARNHGESEHTMDCSFNHNVYDLYHFMDNLKIDKAILVGHNMGGITAIRAALQEPRRLETAFIVDMHVDRIPHEQIQKYLRYMQSCAAKLHDTPKEVPRPNLALVRFPPPLEKLADEGLFRSVLTFRFLAVMDALMQYDKYPIGFIGKYHEPVYFLYGSKSPYCVQDHLDNIIERFPSAVITRFEGGSSNTYLEHTDEFVNVLYEKIPRDLISRWF